MLQQEMRNNRGVDCVQGGSFGGNGSSDGGRGGGGADDENNAVSAELRHLSLDDDGCEHDTAWNRGITGRILANDERAALMNSFASSRREMVDEADEAELERLGDG